MGSSRSDRPGPTLRRVRIATLTIRCDHCHHEETHSSSGGTVDPPGWSRELVGDRLFDVCPVCTAKASMIGPDTPAERTDAQTDAPPQLDR